VPRWWSLFIVSLIAFPAALAVLTELVRKPQETLLRLHLKGVSEVAAQQGGQVLLTLIFLPYDAWISLDAVVRTLGRLLFTRRNLLEWQTAGDAEQRSDGSLQSFAKTMWSAPVLAFVIGAALLLAGRLSWTVVPFLCLWTFAPGVAWWISLPLTEKRAELSSHQILYLRKLARKTWRFFETFAGPEDHWLPPDNFQEHPHPVLATRTSPTNIGMSLLCTLSAYDFGYLSLRRLVLRLTHTFETLEKLERYQGHFYKLVRHANAQANVATLRFNGGQRQSRRALTDASFRAARNSRAGMVPDSTTGRPVRHRSDLVGRGEPFTVPETVVKARGRRSETD
jgi:hypothetical protein